MGKIRIQKGSETRVKLTNGFGSTTMLPGVYPDVEVDRCALAGGADWNAPLFKFEDKVQVLFFFAGKGYLCLPDRAYNITEEAVFVPYFDTAPFSVHAAPGANLEFLRFVCRQTDFDRRMMTYIRTTLPRFKLMSECETYEEEFKAPGSRSPILIMHRLFGKFSMGATLTDGPAKVGEHSHSDLVQWYFLLPGSHIQYTAGGEAVDLVGGDLSYITEGVPHGSTIAAGEKCDYVWFEVALNGYQL